MRELFDPIDWTTILAYRKIKLALEDDQRREETMIAVVGATGNTGRAVVKELTRIGQAPICVVRNPDKAREVLDEHARTVVAELTDRPALAKALEGVNSIFVVTGHNPNMVEQQNSVLDAALEAGVQYLVRVSGSPFLSYPIYRQSSAAVTTRSRRPTRKWY